jgi:GNAT superfamily N-acetyltransferase
MREQNLVPPDADEVLDESLCCVCGTKMELNETDLVGGLIDSGYCSVECADINQIQLNILMRGTSVRMNPGFPPGFMDTFEAEAILPSLELGVDRVGRVTGYVIHLDDIVNCKGDAEVFSVFTEMGLEDYLPIFDEYGDVLEDLFEDFPPATLVVIGSVVVRKDLRGHDLGHKLVAKVIRVFTSSLGMAALEPWPIDFEIQAGGPSLNDVKKKLMAYWSRMGFKAVEGANLMVLDRGRLNPLIDGQLG